MPPRKSKAAGAAQAVSASQPTPQRPTRSSARTRRHSDASAVSDVPSSEQVTASLQTPAKRGRKRKVTAPVEPEVIVEEEDEVMQTDDLPAPACDGSTKDQQTDSQEQGEEESIQVSQSTTRHVHFGSDMEGVETVETTATHITPHPRIKMTIKNKKRRTVSPEKSNVKRQRTSRTSLPAALSQEDPVQIIQDIEFAPLRSLIEQRIQRLSAAKDDFVINDADHQLLGEAGDLRMADDDMPILSRLDEMTIPQLSTLPHTPSKAGEASAMANEGVKSKTSTSPGAYERAKWEEERKKFADAIIALQKESEEARAHLRVLSIELESIGFAKGDASSLEIIHSIRESFAEVREFLEAELPGSLPEEASNQDLAEILVTNVKEFADRLRTADKEQRENGQLVKNLHGQIDGLVDHIADREMKSKELHNQLADLEDSIAYKDAAMGGLEQSLREMQEKKDDIEKQLDDEIMRADELAEDKSNLEKNLERLSTSLKEYQTESAKLTNQINSMEEEHRATVTAMNKEREETVRDLEGRLDHETTRRGKADKLGEDRMEAIKQLEVKLQATETARDKAQAELQKTISELKAEKEKRENAEADLVEKTEDIEDLEHRVRQLDNEIDQYEEEVNNLRQLCDSHRQQREAAEADLDKREVQFDELDKKLREQGQAANELRQKLFEVQKQNEAQVKELQDAASERDVQFQADMAAEVQRREAADELAQARAANILNLQNQLRELETKMRVSILEKDKEIERLQDEVANRDAELQNLRDQFNRDEESYQKQIQQSQQNLEGLRGDINGLQQKIRALEQEAINHTNEHNTQMVERAGKIAVLENQRAALEMEKTSLTKEIASLELRISDEAQHLLQLQAEKDEEVEALKDELRDKQRKIENVEKKVRKSEKAWEKTLAAQDEQIQHLTTTTSTQAQVLDTMKQKFRDYVRRSSGFIEELQRQVDANKVYADEEGRVVQDKGADLLKELQDLPVPTAIAMKTRSGQLPRDSGVAMVHSSEDASAGEEEVMLLA